MNIKLSERALRVRVLRSEFDALLSSRAIKLDVELPRNHTFRVNVRPAMIGGWSLESDPTGLWIAIPRSELQALSQLLPSPEGLEHAFDVSSGGQILVSFEVDVREQS
ncbi:MAG: hypothetical protein ACJ8OJ_03050 [Povalibacter sp.]|jgi:hypothetical protein